MSDVGDKLEEVRDLFDKAGDRMSDMLGDGDLEHLGAFHDKVRSLREKAESMESEAGHLMDEFRRLQSEMKHVT